MLAAVTGEADSVQLVQEAGEAARCALLLVLLFIRLVAYARRECDARRVRRPRDRLDGFLQVGEFPCFAPLRRDHVEVGRRLLVAAPVRGEREPLAVRRPAGRTVAALAGGEPAGL